LNEARIFHDPIVTTLEPLEAFYVAEEYHQDYAARNPNQPYVAYVALPKGGKTAQEFRRAAQEGKLILGACSATDHGFSPQADFLKTEQDGSLSILYDDFSLPLLAVLNPNNSLNSRYKRQQQQLEQDTARSNNRDGTSPFVRSIDAAELDGADGQWPLPSIRRGTEGPVASLLFDLAVYLFELCCWRCICC